MCSKCFVCLCLFQYRHCFVDGCNEVILKQPLTCDSSFILPTGIPRSPPPPPQTPTPSHHHPFPSPNHQLPYIKIYLNRHSFFLSVKDISCVVQTWCLSLIVTNFDILHHRLSKQVPPSVLISQKMNFISCLSVLFLFIFAVVTFSLLLQFVLCVCRALCRNVVQMFTLQMLHSSET